LPWREVHNGQSYVGELMLHGVEVKDERYQALALRAADPVVSSPIPELYEPVLVAFSTLAFRLRGFERVESPQGAFSVVQEWHCERP
jgi:hypothetical protein